ncbi:hypothetical protein EG329_003748 [Mollisiaceae sp. DMI_Dod_QoI]|nr:hypothetical protein EG329_003748 [Helotiales sp. DMI_Dod_QoI]
MAHSCTHCQKYIFVQPQDQSDYSWSDVLEVDLQSIIVGASDGCAFFKWCISQRPEVSDPTRLQELQDRLVLRAEMWAGPRSNFLGQSVMLRWVDQSGTPGDNLESYLKLLYTLAEVGEPAAHYNIARHIYKSVGSPVDFELARSWLEECNKMHPMCKLPKQDTLPLRVIEIHWGEAKHEPTLRLTKSTDKSPYAALSYCWGESSGIDEVKLSSKTRLDWLSYIPFSRLPKTLQDGIITTWQLGLHFLWIDCLCIAQDDEIEKATEIAKMPQIYRGAYITISAARSKSSDEGFLHDIQVPSKDASIFKMAYTCPKGRVGTILLFDDPIPQMQEPIDTRGWTLQEYLLSPRLLIYGIHGLRFCCRKGERLDNEGTTEETLSAWNSRRLASLREVPKDIEMAQEKWPRILTEYSTRTLSDPEDRLLAISGIANHYSELFRDEYLAGIWRRDLPAGLMWSNIHRRYPRPLRSRAPSWSWAAIDGRAEIFWLSLVDPHLSIISHSIQLVEPTAPFGAVISGRLTLKGLLRNVLWDGNSLFPTTSSSTAYLASTDKDVLDETEISGSETGFIEVWCLQICPLESTTRGPAGLILKRECEQIFRRLGTFIFYNDVVKSDKRDAAFDSRFNTEQREWSLSSEMQQINII